MNDDEKKLRDELAVAMARHRVACAEKYAAENRLAEHLSPFKLGQIIQWQSGRFFARGRVESVSFSYGTTIQWQVTRITKDGLDGKLQNVYGFQSPTAVEP